MTISKRQYIVIGSIAYLLALLLTLPANLFTSQINRLHPQLQVSGIEGSLWRGQVDQLLFNQKPIKNLQWDFQPLALLLGRIQLRLAYQDRDNNIELDMAMSIRNQLQITNLEGQINSAFIQSYTPYTVPALHGVLVFKDLDVILAGRRPLRAEGELEWRGAEVDLGQMVSLGNVLLSLEQTDKGIKALLTEQSGLLQGEAGLLLDEEGHYTLEARFTPTSKGKHLERHLALVLRKTSDGSYQRSLNGQFP